MAHLHLFQKHVFPLQNRFFDNGADPIIFKSASQSKSERRAFCIAAEKGFKSGEKDFEPLHSLFSRRCFSR
jgi:hypothetical protein